VPAPHADVALITRSLEIAGERLPRFERHVFARLFAMHPEFEPLFGIDCDWGVRGSMVETCIDCLLDHAAGGEMAGRMILAERLRHPGYGVPEDRFHDLFLAIRDCVREGGGADWSPDMDREWTRLLAALDAAGR
jgi:hypothetical protein